MKNALSKFVFGLSWLFSSVTFVLTLLWFSIVIDHDGRGGMVTRSVIGPLLAVGLLVLAVIPSAVLYVRGHQRRDGWSFAMSGVSFLAVLGETVALFFVRLHGPW
jgi:hypothetical protein